MKNFRESTGGMFRVWLGPIPVLIVYGAKHVEVQPYSTSTKPCIDTYCLFIDQQKREHRYIFIQLNLSILWYMYWHQHYIWYKINDTN